MKNTTTKTTMDTKNNLLIPVLGQAVEATKVKGVYIVKEKAVLGMLYQMDCPVCHQQLLVKAKVTKPSIERCKHCSTKIVIQGMPKPSKEHPVQSSPTQETKHAADVILTDKLKLQGKKGRGKLVWGNMFSRKSYTLHEGENYIGRFDQENPSDVSIHDEYVSRRSILIEVENTPKGYTYKLIVMKCTNPVLINGQAQEVGNSLYLNYGDTIRVGNTILALKPEKK